MTTTTYTCPYCRQQSDGAADSCPFCGAPVDVRIRTTEGGWTDLPAIKDMTRLQVGQSSVQIEGSIAGVADWELAAGDGLFFPHNTLLWKDASVTLDTLPLSKPWTRHRAGLPIVMARAGGPGHVAFTHGTPGEIVALPVQPGASIDVSEHRLVSATHAVGYDWFETGVWYATRGRDSADSGAGAGLLRAGLELAGNDQERRNDETEWHYPMGRFLDRFTAGERPGLVLIGAGGNAYVRTLAEGETILVKPPALIFKDPSVSAYLHVEYPNAPGIQFWKSWGNRYLWLRLWGPGRVGIESKYVADADPGTDFHDLSQHTRHMW